GPGSVELRLNGRHVIGSAGMMQTTRPLILTFSSTTHAAPFGAPFVREVFPSPRRRGLLHDSFCGQFAAKCCGSGVPAATGTFDRPMTPVAAGTPLPQPLLQQNGEKLSCSKSGGAGGGFRWRFMSRGSAVGIVPAWAYH